ncbi:ABC transporter ATP-binding protein [Halorussus pelagicus]|uniref:ABC transporter ATP-binding protein n=1 Tax=Halorussus pelagicus TaxID=2505977 RepID=UPI000FFB633F|nr:ABC transporter ATP-binding protein [Halorussus pelagicus]
MAASDSDADSDAEAGDGGGDGNRDVGGDADGDGRGDSERRRESREAAVELRGVRKTYFLGEPVHALDGVDISIPRGSYTSVMGPSGSGKSTLLNLIGCLDTPSEGEVWVNGRETSDLSQRERTQVRGEEVGFVFQTFNLMPKLTAAENVALPLVFQGVSKRERIGRAEELLDDVGLGDRADHRPNELSGGQRQRVAIARALAADPAIILADEPTGNLDQETGKQIMGLFQRLHDEGNTVLMVTHERPIAEHSERVIHVLDGTVERIEEIESPRRVESELA